MLQQSVYISSTSKLSHFLCKQYVAVAGHCQLTLSSIKIESKILWLTFLPIGCFHYHLLPYKKTSQKNKIKKTMMDTKTYVYVWRVEMAAHVMMELFCVRKIWTMSLFIYRVSVSSIFPFFQLFSHNRVIFNTNTCMYISFLEFLLLQTTSSVYHLKRASLPLRKTRW